MYLVQSVLFDKSKFSLHLSKEWLKHHHYKHLDVDEKPNTWRFRQVSPKDAKKQGYTNFKTKKLEKSGVSLVLAYNQEKSGGGLHNDELYHFLFNSYSNGKDYKYWVLDHSLSDNQVQVYFNNLNHLAVVVHRGSQDLQDWYENAKTAVGLNEGKRLEHSRIIQKKAELKYGPKNVITIGHSKGALHAEKVGQNSGEIITLNKPVTAWDVVSRKKVPEHQTDIKTGLDPVSFLRRFQPGNKYEHIESGSYNPFKEHSTDVLVDSKEGLTEKYWGKGRCWKGYEPVSGMKPYSKGSCRKSGSGSGASVSKTQEKFDNCLEILNEIYERNLEFNNRLEDVIVDNVTEALRLLNNIPTDENIYKLFEVIKELLGLYDSPTSSNLVRHLVNVYNKIVSNYPNYFKLTKPIRVDDFIKPEKADIIPLKDPNTIPIATDLHIRHFTQEQEMTDYLDELIIRLEGSINHFSQIRFNPDDILLVQDYYNTQDELNALMNRFREVFDFIQNQPLKLQRRLATKYIKFFNRFLKRRTDLEKIFRKADALRIYLEKNVINVRNIDDENLARERDQMEDEDKYKKPSSGSGRGREMCISCE
jgi:hypothetical protein